VLRCWSHVRDTRIDDRRAPRCASAQPGETQADTSTSVIHQIKYRRAQMMPSNKVANNYYCKF
jgi:hypothetical protein